MKSLITVLSIATFLTTAASAQDAHRHEPGVADESMQLDIVTAAMDAHMRKMQSLMDHAKAEQDPEARERLLQEHLAAMEQGMRMMNESLDAQEDAAGMSMEGRMGMMKDCMDMMQMMMEQMMGQMQHGGMAPPAAGMLHE